ncbi:MAG: 3-phosphoshikimate 1-carboxyvinyltransferase [Spirochaetales bacterium]
MTLQRERKTIAGSIDAPASKSSMQRAVACATMAEGRSRLKSGELCADSSAALGLAASLGAAVSFDAEAIAIVGSARFGSSSGDFSGELELDCGESGLCMRMFSPIAAILNGRAKLLGRGSLAKRPMGMVEEPLRALGAECRSTAGFPPLFVRGPLRGGAIDIDASESSQLLTGLLVALPLAPEDSELRVSNAVSKGYLDLTIDTCAAFGVAIERDPSFSRFFIQGGQRYRATDFPVEGDWSGAAFLVVAAAIAAGPEGLEIGGLRMESSQPDKAVLRAATAAGAPIGGHGAGLHIGRARLGARLQARLQAFEFDATDCPDLFPPLAALAAACVGVSGIKGVHRLKGKESDRAASIESMLGALGVPVSFEKDWMRIHGGVIHGGTIDACGDHRIAMAAAVAALAAEGPVTILGAECVSKSWPSFFDDLDSVSH